MGERRVHGLPDPPVPVKIGSGSGCEIRLDDPSGLLSREHASLTPVVDGWKIVIAAPTPHGSSPSRRR